jgi:hypothetical protein
MTAALDDVAKKNLAEETALKEEMTEHLGCGKHDPAHGGSGNIPNGTRAKTVVSERPREPSPRTERPLRSRDQNVTHSVTSIGPVTLHSRRSGPAGGRSTTKQPVRSAWPCAYTPPVLSSLTTPGCGGNS